MSSDGNEASKPSSSSQLSEFNQSISILSQKFKSISSEECFQQERYSLSSVIFKWITIVLVINCAFELTVVIILYYGGLELLDDMDEIFLWSLIFFPVCAVIVILEYILLKKANFRYERGALIITAFYIGWLTYPNYGEGGTEGQTFVIIIAVSAIILGQHICYSWIVATGVMALNALIQIIYHGITGDLRSAEVLCLLFGILLFAAAFYLYERQSRQSFFYIQKNNRLLGIEEVRQIQTEEKKIDVEIE